jgi:L-lactate dehydrogenase complex protein LldE
MKVSLFVTCLTDNFFPEVAASVVKVLRRFGVSVDFPHKQTCCGQPALNSGCYDDFRHVARHMMDVFEPSGIVVTPSASCCSIVREHFPHAFEADPVQHARATALVDRTFEFVEFLERQLKVDWSAWDLEWPGVVTYHYSCHSRGCGITDETIRLLKRIRGVEYRPIDKLDQCCGFGGTFAVKYPDISGAMVRDKVANIRKTGADWYVCNDGGCTLNIAGACRREGVNAKPIHIAQILDQAMAAAEHRVATS